MVSNRPMMTQTWCFGSSPVVGVRSLAKTQRPNSSLRNGELSAFKTKEGATGQEHNQGHTDGFLRNLRSCAPSTRVSLYAEYYWEVLRRLRKDFQWKHLNFGRLLSSMTMQKFFTRNNPVVFLFPQIKVWSLVHSRGPTFRSVVNSQIYAYQWSPIASWWWWSGNETWILNHDSYCLYLLHAPYCVGLYGAQKE